MIIMGGDHEGPLLGGTRSCWGRSAQGAKAIAGAVTAARELSYWRTAPLASPKKSAISTLPTTWFHLSDRGTHNVSRPLATKWKHRSTRLSRWGLRCVYLLHGEARHRAPSVSWVMIVSYHGPDDVKGPKGFSSTTTSRIRASVAQEASHHPRVNVIISQGLERVTETGISQLPDGPPNSWWPWQPGWWAVQQLQLGICSPETHWPRLFFTSAEASGQARRPIWPCITLSLFPLSNPETIPRPLVQGVGESSAVLHWTDRSLFLAILLVRPRLCSP